MGLETLIRLLIGSFLYSVFGGIVNYVIYVFVYVTKYIVGVFIFIFSVFGLSTFGKSLLVFGFFGPIFFFMFDVLKGFLFK